MHIVLGILGVVAALSYYFFVLRRGAQAAGEAVDMAQRVRGKMRRNAFRKKAEGSVLSSVEDPGTAAAVVFMKLAEMDGVVLEDTKEQIVTIIRDEIGMKDAEEVMPFAEWIAKQSVNPSDIIRAYKGIWSSNLDPTQMAEFIDMAARVANLSGEPNQDQREMLRLMRERLLS